MGSRPPVRTPHPLPTPAGRRVVLEDVVRLTCRQAQGAGERSSQLCDLTKQPVFLSMHGSHPMALVEEIGVAHTSAGDCSCNVLTFYMP